MTKYRHRMLAAVFILGLLPLVGALTRPSTMSLENNGYKNMVLAVQASVQEDPTVVQGIKDALVSASKYLYIATRHRAFFKEITILLPNTWTPDASYAQHTSESVALADVILYDTSRKRRSFPHTRSYEGCGRQGVHVHLTREFVTQPRAAPYFTYPEKYFVHAFAQFRWGVFQEFAEIGESEFYLSIDSGHPEAIRCVNNTRGLIMKNDVNHTICYSDAIDPATGLYPPDCLWRPYPYHQPIKASFMDHHYIREIVTFCDDSSDFTLRHNYETPSKHNRLCDHRSTWDIITNTPDFENGANPPRPGLSVHDVTPTFKIVRAPARRKRAVITMDAAVGNSDVLETDIMMSVDQLKHEMSKHSVEIAVHHNSTVSSVELVSPPGDSHFVWLYSDNSTTNTSELAQDITSASFVLLTSDPSKISGSQEDGADHVTSTSAGRNVFMDTLRHVITTDLDMSEDIVTVQRKTVQIPPGGYTGSVTLDTSLQRAAYFRFHYDTQEPTVELQSPSGTRFDMDTVVYHVDTQLQMVEFTLLDDQFEVGTWLYYIRSRDNAQEDVSVLVTSLPNTYHEDHLQIKTSARKYTSPYNHLVLHVDVLCHMNPVVGLHVTARVIAPDGDVEEVQLMDNGAGADTAKHDGVYSRYYTNLTMSGIYHVTFVVIGDQGQFYIREDSEDVSDVDVNEDGVIPTVKSSNRRPTGSDVHRHVTVNSIRHYAESDIADDVIPPSRISDLKVLTYLPYKRSFVLQWTAPGDNLDSGKVSQYHIWIGRDLQDIRHLRDMPSTGDQPATGHVKVEYSRKAHVAGVTEVFIWPVDYPAKTFTFGVQAEDAAGNMARMSNIATGSYEYS